MPSYNKVILLGHLTRDPELLVTQNGMSICKFGLAMNRTFYTANGDRREEVTFVDVDTFGRVADSIAKYLTKGRPVLIEGRLKFDSWQQNGQRRSKLGVVGENFQFVDPNPNGNGNGSASAPTKPKTAEPAKEEVTSDAEPF